MHRSSFPSQGGVYFIAALVLFHFCAIRLIAVEPPAADMRAAAIAAFQESGTHPSRKGSMTFVRRRGEPSQELSQLQLYTAKVDNRLLAQVEHFPELTVLELYETRVNDDGLATVARLSNLTQLSFLPIDRYEKTGIKIVQWSYPSIPRATERTPITDAGLRQLRSCSKLRTLDLADTQVTAAGLTALLDLPQLESLSLSFPLNEQAAAVLNRLPKLKHLGLTGDAATADSLRWIAKTPHVRSLLVWDRPLDAQSMATLGELSQLETLWLPNCGLTDASLPPLGLLKNLRSLRLGRNEIHGSGLSALKTCPQLQILFLDYTDLGDDDLRYLAELPALEDLMLNYNTGITNAGLSSGVLQNIGMLRKLMLRGLTQIDDSAFDAFVQMKQLRGLVVRSTPVSLECVVKLRGVRPDLDILK